MKANYIKGITGLCVTALLFFSSCLKDARYFDPTATQTTIVEMPLSGFANFSADAVTAPGPLDTVLFTVNVASNYAPTTPTTVTVGVDASLVAPYVAANPAVNYLVVPSNAYTFPDLTVTIPAGQRLSIMKVVFDKSKLDPSLSYMLPIKIKSAGGLVISANYSTHYFHFIGNDFAGAYVWDYRRYNNGVGPVPYVIPSQNPTVTSGGTTLGQAGKINPVSPTEFTMLTGYNGTGVQYDVTFTRTVSGSVVTYTNWKVSFDAANLQLWTNAGITNFVPPAFTIPPPTDNSSAKIFEMNYVSGGASARYIDDTYHK